ncbi:MAG: bifunctional DNA-formamidopyrimidine glycosylase/DNA-(apurinic or apyrimidinic site) lyase [Candidatus Bipolaricaulota bacterium]|nr:bifunctional DNA-formamidopyrimidine glycosylase/DNA-(apurinic or apyrimidinic site) lyase [Candidatus Bipolaricaulota bacterium]
MPELPEVETVVRGLDSRVTGKTIDEVEIHDPELPRNVEPENLPGELEGKRVTDVRRRGKYVLLEAGGNKLVTIHLRMTGKLLVCSRDEDTDYQRITFSFDEDGKLVMDDLRRLGTLDLLESENEEPLSSLGLEPFTDSYRWEEFRELFDTTQPLKLTLLDQNKITGLGNIYASEVLFRAGLSPLASGNEISEAGKKKLFEVIPEVLSEAIENNGTTFSNFLDSSGETGNFQEFLRVYQKEGEPCPACGAEIARADQSGRGSYYCPNCQDKG